MRLVVFASGNGSNFEAIANACQNNHLSSTVELLIVDQEDAQVIKRAKKLNIPYKLIKLKDFASKEIYEQEIVRTLEKVKPELICLAGYMKKIEHTLLDKYPNKIINIHPSLLPKYSGKDGFVNSIKANESFLGATVHYVNEEIDAGEIIDQISFENFTSNINELTKTLHDNEHVLYIRVIKKLEVENEKSFD